MTNFEDQRDWYLKDEFEAKREKELFVNQLKFYLSDMQMNFSQILKYLGLKRNTENSSYFAYPLEKRREIVFELRDLQNKGEIVNKDTWANERHHISGKTLHEYELEFLAKG